jgi:hypothetical protein
LETTLLLQNLNSSGDLIYQILYNAYENKKELWSDNAYQFPYIINEQFMRNIAIAFYKKNLKLFQEKEEALITQLTLRNSKELFDVLQDLDKQKQKHLQKKRSNQHESLLPKEFKMLNTAIKVFEKINKKQKEVMKKKETKEKGKILIQEKKQQQEKEAKNKPQTAKQKREEYQQMKTLESNNDETIS